MSDDVFVRWSASDKAPQLQLQNDERTIVGEKVLISLCSRSYLAPLRAIVSGAPTAASVEATGSSS